MRIGQEAHVENEVGIGRNAVAIAKADARNQHRALFGIAEAFGDEVAQFVNVEFRGVDHDVGKLADGLQQLAFVIEALAHAEMFSDGMRPAGLAVAPEQSILSGFDKDEGNGMHAAKMLQERGQLLKLVAFTSIDKQRSTGKTAFAGSVEFGKNWNQFDGKIVDAIETHVLECVQDGALSGAGESGEDDELAGFGSIG